MEPFEGALLLSGMTKTEGFQFSHAHNACSLCLVMPNNRNDAGENRENFKAEITTSEITVADNDIRSEEDR